MERNGLYHLELSHKTSNSLSLSSSFLSSSNKDIIWLYDLRLYHLELSHKTSNSLSLSLSFLSSSNKNTIW